MCFSFPYDFETDVITTLMCPTDKHVVKQTYTLTNIQAHSFHRAQQSWLMSLFWGNCFDWSGSAMQAMNKESKPACGPQKQTLQG